MKIKLATFSQLTSSLISKKPPKNISFSMKSVHQYLKKEGSSTTERSVFQLLDAIRLSDKELLNSYKATSKTHSTMGEKFFIPLCAEHIHSLIKKKCGWNSLHEFIHIILLSRASLRKNLSSRTKFPDKMQKLAVRKTSIS